MIAYIIKFILCSALFLLYYRILLEKEKLHSFNRAYLISTVIISLIGPLLTLRFETSDRELFQTITSISESISTMDSFYGIEQKATFLPESTFSPSPAASYPFYSFETIIIVLYVTVVGLLMFRVAKNIYLLFKKINGASCIPIENARLVLIDSPLMPFTFLNYIFINKQQYFKRLVSPAVLEHELVHARQKHTFDIIFIEIVKAFFFFNPFLYSFRKAIQLNHEFLADDEAKKMTETEREYQYLLLNATKRYNKQEFLSNSFYYLVTKKRIKMITQKTRPAKKIVRGATVLTLVIATLFFFGFKAADSTVQQIKNVIAMPVKDTLKKPLPYDTIPKLMLLLKENTIGFTEEGVSQEELDEFQKTLMRYYDSSGKIHRFYPAKITQEEKKELEAIYKRMSLRQQSGLPIAITKPLKPSPRMKLSEKLFQSFKNPGVYGIWVDDRRVSNTILDKYKAEDFSSYFISKLYGVAKKGRSYTHQVNMMTNAYYDKYYKAAINNKENWITLRAYYNR